MSDALTKPSLGISKMSRKSISKVFENLNGIIDTKGGVPTSQRANYKTIQLPLGGKGKLFIKGLYKDGYGELPTHIEFKSFHAPNILFGHNLVHGTSVNASVIACWWAFKIWLASIGVDSEDIEKLTKGDIDLDGVDVTYLKQHDSQAEAARYVSLFAKVAEASGRTVTSHHSTNVTCDLTFSEVDVSSYNKTNLSHCRLPKNMIGEQIKELGNTLSRIEVKLRRKKLLKLNLAKGSSWESAYADDLYRTLYEDHVSAAIPAAKITRQKKPYPEAFQAAVASMKPERQKDALQLLDRYFNGQELHEFANSEGLRLSDSQIRNFRTEFLKHLGIDIGLNWATSVYIGLSDASGLLAYPGDFEVVGAPTRASFCKESWPTVLEKLKNAYSSMVDSKRIDLTTGEILQW